MKVDRIEWDPALDTGDETVDSQHRELVAMLNRLHAAEASPDADARRLIPEILEGLSAYVSTHFACEQELMMSTDMPEAALNAHLAEHTRLTDRTRDFVLAFRRGEMASIVPLVDFMHQWLAEHVQRLDRELVDHVQKRTT